jgi:two-component system, OmpR family, alkaline phosphatase synthesis response regulator PhoP
MGQQTQLIYVIDEPGQLRDLIEYYLKQSGFSVIVFDNSQQCKQSIDYLHPIAIIIDTSSTLSDGFDFCKELKEDSNLQCIKVILLIDHLKQEDIDKVFKYGADDFIEKPFNLNELKVRLSKIITENDNQVETYSLINNHSRHTPNEFRKKQKEKTYKIRNMIINLNNYEITIHNKKISLSFCEFQLLVFLIKKTGTPCSREEIIKHDGGDKYIITDRAVDVRIAGIRKKLGGYGRMIKTIRSVGYVFVET